MNPDTKSRLEALRAPASPVPVAVPLADIDRAVNLAKLVDFAGEISLVVDQVKGLATDGTGMISAFRRDAPSIISNTVRQELKPVVSALKASDSSASILDTITTMRVTTQALHETVRVVAGISILLWVLTMLVILLSR